MRRLSGHAEATCDSSASSLAQLLLAVDRYPSWHSEVVRKVVARCRDDAGRLETIDVTLRVAIGPVHHDLELTLAISAALPDRITLTRLPNEPGDPETFVAVWRLDDGRRTTIGLDVEAKLDLPRLVPLAGIGDRLAQGFVDAAVARAGGG
jgi:hypothetical protein